MMLARRKKEDVRVEVGYRIRGRICVCLTRFFETCVECGAESCQICLSHVPGDHKNDLHGKVEGMSPVAGHQYHLGAAGYWEVESSLT